jgi:bacillopeptidase F (M6 metalloprotease family)
MRLKEFLNLPSNVLLTNKDADTLYSIESLHRGTEDDAYGTTLITLYVENSFTGNKSRKLVSRKDYKDYQVYKDLMPSKEPENE